MSSSVKGVLLGCCLQGLMPGLSVASELEQKIDYLEQRIEKHPTSFALYPQLATHYLELARKTADSTPLKKAEDSLRRSLSIQPNRDAFLGMAALNNYRHRFADALTWAARAREVDATDPRLISLMVEANLGLGRPEAAKQLVEQGDPAAFHVQAAYAQYYLARKDYPAARTAYQRAAVLAGQQGEKSYQVWAIINAGGMLIDSGRAMEAKADLDRAQQMAPGNKLLEIHWAEYEQATGQPRAALQRYQRLLAQYNDPWLAARAWAVASQLGDEEQARRLFAMAESGFDAVIEAGEVYTLGALAQLYCDAGVKPERASELARRNLEFIRDVHARETANCANG